MVGIRREQVALLELFLLVAQLLVHLVHCSFSQSTIRKVSQSFNVHHLFYNLILSIEKVI